MKTSRLEGCMEQSRYRALPDKVRRGGQMMLEPVLEDDAYMLFTVLFLPPRSGTSEKERSRSRGG